MRLQVNITKAINYR